MIRRGLVITAAFVLAATGLVFTQEGGFQVHEILNGLKEAPAVVSTTGNGTFRAVISRDESEIAYELSFSNLEGEVRQAHIHIGHPQNTGGVVLWLCDSDTNPAPSPTTPPCTQDNPLNTTSGRVTGTLTAEDVRDQPTNGIAGAPTTTPGEFSEVIGLIRAGRTYVNVHTARFPPGEIRSQIDNRDGHEH